MRDPIVNEIRDIRHEIERVCKGDSEEFYKWIIASQQKFGKRLVRRQPKFLSVETAKKSR